MGDSKYNCVRFAVGIATGMRVSSQLQLAIHTCQICVSECQRWSENAGRICNCPCKMKKIKWFMASNYISVRHVHHMACMRKLHSIQFGSRIRNSFAQRASQNTCQNAQRQTCFHPHKSQVQRRISTDYITCLHLSQVFTFSDWFINIFRLHWIGRRLQQQNFVTFESKDGWRWRGCGYGGEWACATRHIFFGIILNHSSFISTVFPYISCRLMIWRNVFRKAGQVHWMFFFSINFFIAATWNGIDRSGLDRCTATPKACKNIRSKFHASAKPRSTAGIAERKRVMGPKSWSICCIQTLFHASALSPHPFPVGSNPRSTTLSWYKNINRGMH